MKNRGILVILLILICQMSVYAERIYLKNGDRITGEVIGQDSESISVRTEAMGVVSFKRDSVARIEDAREKEAASVVKKEEIWQREFSLGYDKTSGNTQSSQFSLRLYANRKTGHDEFTVKGDVFYSSSDREMDSQRWYGLLRYAFSFWQRKWYNFYKIEADHDRFANIDYRLIPAAGLGYWFSDKERWKAMAELGVGWEHTEFRDSNTGQSNEAILVPRGFCEKKIFDNLKISEDITLYSSLEDTGEYRLHSETTLTNTINERLSFSFSFIDDYNSAPAEDTRKNDLRFISALTWSF